jgi:hypothetical protein
MYTSLTLLHETLLQMYQFVNNVLTMYSLIILKPFNFFMLHLCTQKNERIPIYILFWPTLDIINIITIHKIVYRSLNSPNFFLNISSISRTCESKNNFYTILKIFLEVYLVQLKILFDKHKKFIWMIENIKYVQKFLKLIQFNLYIFYYTKKFIVVYMIFFYKLLHNITIISWK